MTTAIYIVLGIFGFIIIISMFRTKKFLLSLFMTALQGIASIIAANFIGGFFGVHLSVNAFSLGVCGLGGLPGTVMLLITDTLFKI